MLKIVLLSLLSFSFIESFSQSVGIGTNTPDASAQLDVSSTNKGFLPPRLTAAQRKAITSPAAGLVVFDTDASQLYLFDGTSWSPLSASSSGNTLEPPQKTQPLAEQKKTGNFGLDVALADNYAVIGAPNVDEGATVGAGAAYVYKKDAAGAWAQSAKLIASDLQAGAAFGISVAIAGNYIVVGALATVSGKDDAGKVYVYVKGAGDTWTEQTSFTKPGGAAASERFGFNVAISISSASGPAFIVGAPYVSTAGNYKGAAYAYRYTSGAWSYQQALTPTTLNNNDNFGWEVDIDGDYCVVSAPYADNTTFSIANAGRVAVFVFGGGVWTTQQELTRPTVDNASFGFSLSLQGNTLAIGAPLAPQYGNSTSSVYVYQRTGAVWGNMKDIYLLNIPGFDAGGHFGLSIALQNNKLMISMPGGFIYHYNGALTNGRHGYVFVYEKGADDIYYITKTIDDNEPFNFNGNTNFGNAVALKNDYYIIGIPGKTIGTVKNAGSVAFGHLE